MGARKVEFIDTGFLRIRRDGNDYFRVSGTGALLIESIQRVDLDQTPGNLFRTFS